MCPLMALKLNALYFCYTAAERIVVLSPIALGLKFRNDFKRTSFQLQFFFCNIYALGLKTVKSTI